MTEITVTCATCSGTGDATHGDRHTSTNMDRCRTCGGTGQVPARPGERRETSWPFAVPGARVTGPEIVRHRKTGGLYEVLFRGAKVQTSEPLTDYAEVACYRSLKDGGVWVRPTSKMDDGRFEAVSVTQDAPASVEGLSRQATQGEWFVDSEATDGSYGSGDDVSEGYDTAVICTDAEIRHGKPGVIFEGSNSTVAVIEDEDHEDGFRAWDAVSKANAEFIVALVNGYRSGRLVERTPSGGGIEQGASSKDDRALAEGEAAGASSSLRDCDPSRDSLVVFAKEIIAACWNSHVDDEFVHRASLRHGLVEETVYDPVVHGPNDVDAEPGDPWFIFAGSLIAPGMEAEGRNPQGSGAEHDSPVAAGQALSPTPSPEAPQTGIQVARETLEFYADPRNWIDTPSWDGDPDCITPAAIPVGDEGNGSRPCDCGDRARAALAALQSPSRQEGEGRSDDDANSGGEAPGGWQPMSTAPRNADSFARVLLRFDGEEYPGFWHGMYGWIADLGTGEGSQRFPQCRPEAWRPLPAYPPPSQEKSEGRDA